MYLTDHKKILFDLIEVKEKKIDWTFSATANKIATNPMQHNMIFLQGL